MRIEIDDKSGFCFGVVNAITKAEESLAAGSGDPAAGGAGTEVLCLGDIVHNRLEVQRLEALGLRCVKHKALDALHDATLLIRAHGEPPSTYELAARNNLHIIDATCPVVARLQRLVVQAWEKMRPVGGQVVILGKRGHAEVVGLAGQVAGDVTVVEGIDDLDALDYARPIYLLSQTTQSLVLFGQVGEHILSRAADPAQVTIHDTICRQVSGREEHLDAFAHRFDAVVFVAGKKSSNGRVLFEVCRRANPRTYAVESEQELQAAWFDGCASVGICGATSTPGWLMQRVADRLAAIVG
jgi:4-hydroxy-3-methylbut-2-enyl diphosphate reductase